MIARLKALNDRPRLVAMLMALAALVLFAVHLDRPGKLMFDEVHYVPAARALLTLEGPRNIEHPLVGKAMIAAGMALFGDNPVGWRAAAVLAGAASVAGVFALAWLLTGRMRESVIAGLLAMLNQTLFVQARTGMLDVFLGALLVWAIVLLLAAMRAPPGKVVPRWIGGAALMGLAVGVKWAALPYLALAGLAFVVVRLADARQARRRVSAALTGAGQRHWPGLATIPALALLGGVAAAAYFASFAPAFFYARDPLTLAGLIPLQGEMYALQTQRLPPHNYQSSWWSWPLMLRPIWFFYEPDAGVQRGVLLLGNPAVMWGGLVAVAECLMLGLRGRDRPALAIGLLWVFSVAIFAIIPKSLGFYYYYHASGLFLCVALAVAFARRPQARAKGWDEWFVFAALMLFVYFYPVLAASPLPDAGAFARWTWFPGWR